MSDAMKYAGVSVWLGALLLIGSSSYAQDNLDDIEPWLDASYNLVYKATARPVDPGLSYTLPIVSLHVVDEFNDPVELTEEVVSAFEDLIGLEEDDYVEVSSDENILEYSFQSGFLSADLDDDLKSFIYGNLISRIGACLGAMSEIEISIFEDYIFDPEGSRVSDIGLDAAVAMAKPIADKMHENYQATLCRTEGEDEYQFNSSLTLLLEKHLEALLEASNRNQVLYGSNLLSLFPVFDRLVLSVNNGIYMRLTRALLIQRFVNAQSPIEDVDDIINIKALSNVFYNSYLDFIIDDGVPISFRETVVDACSELNACMPINDGEFNIGSCIVVPSLIGISGFDVTKVLLINSD